MFFLFKKLEGGSEVVHALLVLAERCFNFIEEREGQIYGTNMSSPLTFLRIVQQLHPLIQGGG
jgi:hypothetical protein